MEVSAEQLLDVRIPGGEITEAGLRTNVNVGLRYLASWLSGSGAAAIDNLMEDAATAEISRSQIWQWVEHGAELSSGEPVTAELARATIETEIEALRRQLGEASFAELRFDEARVAVRAGGARAGVRRVPDAPRLRAARLRGWRGVSRSRPRPRAVSYFVKCTYATWSVPSFSITCNTRHEFAQDVLVFQT